MKKTIAAVSFAFLVSATGAYAQTAGGAGGGGSAGGASAGGAPGNGATGGAPGGMTGGGATAGTAGTGSTGSGSGKSRSGSKGTTGGTAGTTGGTAGTTGGTAGTTGGHCGHDWRHCGHDWRHCGHALSFVRGRKEAGQRLRSPYQPILVSGRDSTEGELSAWRRAILSPLAGVCALLSVAERCGFACDAGHPCPHLPDAQIDVFAVMSLMLCGLALWPARSLSLLRCALVSLVSLAFCCNIILYGAFALPGTYVGLLLLIVMVTLICGQRVAWGAVLATVLGLSVVATFHVRGWVPPQGGLLESQVAINWITVVAVFVFASLGAIRAVSYLLEKLEAELRSSRSLTATIDEQSRTAIEALTKQHALEQRLVQGQKTEALGKLAGGVAHDFNNLLTIMMTSMRMAQDRISDTATRELMQDAQDAASRAATLTSDLLAFSRQQVVEHISSNVAAAVTQLVRLLRRLVAEHDCARRSLSSTIRCGSTWPTSSSIKSCSISPSTRATRCPMAARSSCVASATQTECASAFVTPAVAWTQPRWRESSSRSSPPRIPAKARASAWPWCRAS